MTSLDSDTRLHISGPGAWGQSLAFLGRLYPLLSGCGKIANLAVLKRVFPGRERIVWARVGSSRCLVPLDDYVGRAAFLFGDLDPKITWVINRCVRPGDTVLDVGANLGIVTLLLAQKVGATGAVHAFEPSPPVLRLLRETLRQAHLMPIRLHEFAVGDKEGTLTLSIPPENAGAASLVTTHTQAGSASCEVRVERLSACLVCVGEKPVAFMKIDVEGFEASALRGLMEGEDGLHPVVIVLEEHSPKDSEAFTVLSAHRYAILGLERALMRAPRLVARSDTGFLSCHDFVAVHESAPPSVRKSLRL